MNIIANSHNFWTSFPLYPRDYESKNCWKTLVIILHYVKNLIFFFHFWLQYQSFRHIFQHILKKYLNKKYIQLKNSCRWLHFEYMYSKQLPLVPLLICCFKEYKLQHRRNDEKKHKKQLSRRKEIRESRPEGPK